MDFWLEWAFRRYVDLLGLGAGIQVDYCAEQFENDGSPPSTIVKSVKRAMAGEYSRELSAKVFAGQFRFIEFTKIGVEIFKGNGYTVSIV